MSWQTPVTDRTKSDVDYAKANESNSEHNKGALNYTDLNRIEGNYKYAADILREGGYFVKHTPRNYTETIYDSTGTAQTRVCTEWDELNIPWKSEIDRIRQNHNSLAVYFLNDLKLPEIAFGNGLDYAEANLLETIDLIGKTRAENMRDTYIPCGTITCGGVLL